MAKTCSRCLAVKDESDFPKNSASPDGLYSLCKVCRKSAQAAYRARPDVVAREAIRLRQDYLDNKEKRLAQRRARYAADPQAALEKNRQWRQANLEKHREMCPKWAREHPSEMRVLVARRRAMLLGAEGRHTKKDIERMFFEQDGFCIGCRGDLVILGYHVDHIFPLSKGGGNGPENLQLLCPACNRQKADKVDWVPSGS